MRVTPAHPEPIGDQRVDKVVRGVAGVFGQLFPDRIRGCYLRGSRASGTSTAGSDIDMFVVFKDGFVERAEARRAGEAAGYCALLCSTPLEIIPLSEQQLRLEDNLVVALQLKLASRLVYGEDIRRDLPDMDTDAYVRAVAHTPYHSYRHPTQRRSDPNLVYPLRHIDPTGPFYGYDQWPQPGPDGADVPSTKLLVASVGWTATAIIAMRTGRYVRDKSACVALYKEHIADEWTELVVTVHELCRNRWHYRIPPAESDRSTLRALCEQALTFQNHYLGHYRRYLLAELRSGAPDRQLLAIRRLGQIVFPDPEVVKALRRTDHPHLRPAAMVTLENYGAR
jgi:nucleotidyltransferase-like protein